MPVPFPFGRFTEAEWRAAFALSLGPEDAAREAAFFGSTAPALRGADCELSMLAFLALAGPALAERVEAYRRELADARRLPRRRRAEEDRDWQTLLAVLRAAVPGAPGAGGGMGDAPAAGK